MGAAGIVRTEFSPRRIPYSVIEIYAERRGIEGSAFDLLVELLDVIDAEYLAIEGEKAKERAAQKG